MGRPGIGVESAAGGCRLCLRACWARLRIGASRAPRATRQMAEIPVVHCAHFPRQGGQTNAKPKLSLPSHLRYGDGIRPRCRALLPVSHSPLRIPSCNPSSGG